MDALLIENANKKKLQKKEPIQIECLIARSGDERVVRSEI